MKQQNNYIKEIEKQAHVKSHFEKHQAIYSADINLAIYMDLSDVEKLHIFDIISVNDKQDFLVNFYGFRMGLDDHMLDKLYKLFIREMDPLLRNQTKRKYFVVLFDSSSENNKCFDHFRDIFKRLPALYFVKLNKIYHVEPDFLTKTFSLVNFTSWSKLFHKHVEHVQSVQNIQAINDLKIFNILAKCPKQITKGIKPPEQTPNMVRSAFVGTIRSKPFDSLKKEFKDYQIDQVRGVPLILSILIETMKQCRELCLIEGIFRVAGSIEDEEELLKEIKDFKTFRLLDSEAICKRAIAGLMKKIFTESIIPLIPYSIYNYLLNLLNEKIDQSNIQGLWNMIVDQMPKLNRTILCYVTQFLRDFVLKNKEKNKMNAHNLSVVFTPCFFRSKESCLADLINSGKIAAFFKWWLEHYDQIMNKNTPTPQPHQQQEEETLGGDRPERYRKNLQSTSHETEFNSKQLELMH